MDSIAQWNNHYTKDKSSLLYPDENLVRLIGAYMRNRGNTELLTAIDIGCGSGRHIKLLHELGISFTVCSDYSFNALAHSQSFTSRLVQCKNESLPFKNSSFDMAVSWGSLHYTTRENLIIQINEILRILKSGGSLFGTLRSSFDTMLKSGIELSPGTWQTDLKDISGSIVSFYTEEELKTAFRGFSDFSYGIIERTQLNSIDKRISHWYFKAVK
jgi:ubiquinone/menaquinone biosynthesis C-methylase UbiE